MSVEYLDQHQRMITDTEWRAILRLRQCRKAWIDMDALTIDPSMTRTEILGPRVATATAEFLPVDTAG